MSMTMSMNNYSVDEVYRNMLSIFRYNDLQTLLGSFGQNRVGRKSELNDRAIELLRTRPANINYSAYIAKIYEIYRSLQHELPSNDSMMHRLSQNQQHQRQMISSVDQIPLPPQRMYQPPQRMYQPPQRMYQPPQRMYQLPQRMYQPPQYFQQSMHMARAGLPQVMPKMQRDMYGNHISNSIPANSMVNNNVQYIAAGYYQPSGTHTIVSHKLFPNQQTSIVAQDEFGLGTTASGNNSYIPSIETVAQIKFKKIPFYEVIDEVIKPTLLTGTDRCTLLNVPRDMKETTFKHTLSLEHANSVSKNRDISYGKNEYHNQFQIRICQLIEPVPNESPDYMPLGLHIRVNTKACPLPPILPNSRPNKQTEPRRTARPINCTSNFKLSPIVGNNITINWIPDGKNYVFAMYLVKKITVDTLIKKLQDKGGRSSDETKNYIIRKLADDDPDLATTTSYRFSLLCPLTKMRMKIPVKSIHCNHLQCFDAITFILMNEKKPTWMCPTCNKPCLYDNIQIQNYFLEVVTSPTLKDCSKEIELLADGTWRVYEETIETKNTNSTPNNVKPIESVDLDSDDEKCIESKTELSPESSRTQEPSPESSRTQEPSPESSRTQEPSPESSRTQEHEKNLKSSLVDLTLSADEESPTEKDEQENEAQAADAIQQVTVVDLKPQALVQPQQAVTSSEQGLIIEIDSPSPPSSPTPTTETS
ncbi:E3 SUMO-protein ligase PIAS2-like [Aphis craccivora]|uniref:E3 SUMO-protein ligase PIAS2-like n=1 Tax=Aphis craccivora TaxID=307492 RepID=A0A6G0YBR7_APHCR|nr:E3 SUMO-protein ligase PIAS2-like [Aphis craccivora]